MKKGLLIMLALGMTLAISSCKKKEKCYNAQVKTHEALQDYNDAQSAYQYNPTQENENKKNLAKQNYEQKSKAQIYACK